MFNIGEEVIVMSRIGLPNQKALIVDMIPANEYRHAMYRVRFPMSQKVAEVAMTPTPNECWMDAPMILMRA